MESAGVRYLFGIFISLSSIALISKLVEFV